MLVLGSGGLLQVCVCAASISLLPLPVCFCGGMFRLIKSQIDQWTTFGLNTLNDYIIVSDIGSALPFLKSIHYDVCVIYQAAVRTALCCCSDSERLTPGCHQMPDNINNQREQEATHASLWRQSPPAL